MHFLTLFWKILFAFIPPTGNRWNRLRRCGYEKTTTHKLTVPRTTCIGILVCTFTFTMSMRQRKTPPFHVPGLSLCKQTCTTPIPLHNVRMWKPRPGTRQTNFEWFTIFVFLFPVFDTVGDALHTNTHTRTQNVLSISVDLVCIYEKSEKSIVGLWECEIGVNSPSTWISFPSISLLWAILCGHHFGNGQFTHCFFSLFFLFLFYHCGRCLFISLHGMHRGVRRFAHSSGYGRPCYQIFMVATCVLWYRLLRSAL